MVQFLKQHKNKFIWLAIIALIVTGAVVFSGQGNKNGVKYDLIEAKVESLQQSFSATGTLEPQMNIDLSFQSSGLVQEVLKNVGDSVKKGDILAVLENSNEKAGVSQAEASLAEANAQLNLAIANATDEEVRIARTDVDQAQANLKKVGVDLENSKTNLENTQKIVEEQNRVAELEVKNATLALKRAESNSNVTVEGSDVKLQGATSSLKSTMGQMLNAVSASVVTVDKLYGKYDYEVLGDPNSYRNDGAILYRTIDLQLQMVYDEQNRLSTLYYALGTLPSADEMKDLSDEVSKLEKETNTLLVQLSDMREFLSVDNIWLSQSEYDAYVQEIQSTSSLFNSAAATYDSAKSSFDKAYVDFVGTNETSPLDVESAKVLLEKAELQRDKTKVDGDVQIDGAESQVKTLEAQFEVNEALVNKAQAQLDKVLASPRAVDLAPYRARVAQAAAQLEKARSAYNKTVLKAPDDGVILSRDIEVGEQITAGGAAAQKVAFKMMDNSDFHIDVDVPETQVAKISDKSVVTITFDALDDEKVFEGRIVSIEPGPTTIQDVVYYKTKVTLVTKDDRLKTGMTADVQIKAELPLEVLSIPEKALVAIDGKKGVMVPDEKGKPVQKEVRTGIRGDGGLIEVVSGLNSGDKLFVPAL